LVVGGDGMISEHEARRPFRQDERNAEVRNYRRGTKAMVERVQVGILQRYFSFIDIFRRDYLPVLAFCVFRSYLTADSGGTWAPIPA
jgi:hypothetical protein